MSPASYQTAPPRVVFLDEPHLASSARAGNGTRTRDPNLGKVVLYQLSYSRISSQALKTHSISAEIAPFSLPERKKEARNPL